MTLKEIRAKFIALSGRFDLVVDTTDYVDNGADYFIKAGIKFLDRRVLHDKDRSKFFKQFAIGTYFTEFADYRTTDKVYFATTSEGQWELTYVSPSEMQALYPKAFSDVDNGTPKYFTMAITRSVPEGVALDVIGDYGDEIKTDGTQVGKQGLIIMPPPETAGMLEVWGKYNTPWPSLDTGTNFWFDQYEDIAVTAALYKLEGSYRNRQGQADFLASIDQDLLGIEKDAIEDDAGRAEEMEG